MAYVKTDWKNRVVEKPRTFTIQENADGTVTLIPTEGVIHEEGTPVAAAQMNKIEQGIADAFTEIGKKVDKVNAVTSVAGKTGAVTVNKSDVGLGNVENYGIATTAEAQAGTSNTKYMTPLRVKETIGIIGLKLASGSYVGTGTSTRSINVGGNALLIMAYPGQNYGSVHRLTSNSGGKYSTWEKSIYLSSPSLVKTASGFDITDLSMNVEGQTYYWEAWI